MKFNFSILVLCVFFFEGHTQSINNYPAFEGKTTIDTIFGEIVEDNYRVFEDFRNNQDVINFYEKQNDLTEDYFNNSTLANKYSKYLRKIDKNENDLLFGIKMAVNGAIFIHKRKSKRLGNSIYYKKSKDSPEQLLYSPRDTENSPRDTHKITAFKPSWDGKRVLIGVKNNNSYASEVFIIDVKTKEINQTKINNSRPNSYWDFNWIPKTNSFTYTSIRTLNGNDPNNSINTSLDIYNLDSDKITTLIGNGNGHEINDRLIPLTRVFSQNDKYLITYIAGPSSYWDSYYTSIESINIGKPKWKPLFKIEDKIYLNQVKYLNNKLYYVSGKENNFHNISVLNLETNKTKILVPEIHEEKIKEIHLINNAIVFSTIKEGTEAKFYIYKNDTIQQIEIPFQASYLSLSLEPENNNNVYLDTRSLLSSGRRLKYDISNNSFEEQFLYKAADIPEFKDITYKKVYVTSHDGTLVPMTIVYKKGIKLDGNNPVWSLSDGAFGRVEGTKFKTQYLSYVALGGVVVYPHIRGGGAKGDKWHKAGMKTNKSNSWKDLIACMEYLVEHKYTTHKNITMYGGSGGAISIAMAVNEKPDIASVVLLWAGVLNPLRRFDKNGKNSYIEYGDINDPEEAKGLVAMDPYLNIPEQAKLPAMLISHSLNDDRVNLYESLKYVTKAQKNNTKNTNIFFDVDFYGSHKSPSEFYRYFGKLFSFSIDNTPFEPEF